MWSRKEIIEVGGYRFRDFEDREEMRWNCLINAAEGKRGFPADQQQAFIHLFLCRANETSKSDYYFVLKYKNEFKTYLDVLGYRLEVNEELGVIQLVNAYNYNRMNLKLYESIILLILRILYDEKRGNFYQR